MDAPDHAATGSKPAGDAPVTVRVVPDRELECLELFRLCEEASERSRARRSSPRPRRPRRLPAIAVAALAALAAAVISAVWLAGDLDDRMLEGRLSEPAKGAVAKPAQGAVAAVDRRVPAVPTAPAFAAARKFAESREGLVSFAVVDSEGRLRSWNGERQYVSASVVKVLLLTAELRRLEREGAKLDPYTRDLLARMITYSDNAAADAIYARVGDEGLYDVAARAGMRDFSVSGHWTTAQLTADDMARFMSGLDDALVGPHADFASAQLAAIVPEQRWGIPAALGDDWRIRFKGGWRGTELGQLVHQVAALERGHDHLALTVLTDGQPTMDYGIETVGGIAWQLLGPDALPSEDLAPTGAPAVRRALVMRP